MITIRDELDHTSGCESILDVVHMSRYRSALSSSKGLVGISDSMQAFLYDMTRCKVIASSKGIPVVRCDLSHCDPGPQSPETPINCQ